MEIVAGQSDERHSQPLHGGQQLQDFAGLSTGRKRENDITANHHAEVAVQRFRRMEKQGRTACRSERRSDLAGDESTFAHSRDDDSPGAAIEQFDSAFEVGRHRSGKTVCERAQGVGLNAHHAFTDVFHDELGGRSAARVRHCVGGRGSSPCELKTSTCSSFSPLFRGIFLPLNEISTSPALAVQNTTLFVAWMVFTSVAFITPRTRTLPSDLISTRARSLARTITSNGALPSRPAVPVETDVPDALSEAGCCGELSAASTV